MEAVKYDVGKIPWHLLPVESLEEICKVLEFGAKKYAEDNWRLGMSWKRMARAGIGHMFSWLKGEDKDPETGLSHLAHAGCCVLFLLWYEKHKTELDDRWKPPVTVFTKVY